MDLGQVRHSRGYQRLVKGGLVSYGVVHLLVAWIALNLAFGKRGDASPNGALKEVAQQPLGEVLLWVMAVGLFALTIWQLIEATVGRDDPNREGNVKGRARSAGRAAVYLALGLLTIGVATGSGSAQSGQGEETLSAKLMALPFGQILVAALATIKDQPAGTVLLVAMAAGIAGFGAYCFAWARYARY